MDEIQRITWTAALLEGEGSFLFTKGGGRKISCHMTDLDVLERLREFWGGTIAPTKKRKEHWKDAWVWTVYGQRAHDLTILIVPFLLARRTMQANRLLDSYKNCRVERGRLNREKIIVASSDKSLTHAQIAKIVGVERSYVSHVLGGSYKRVPPIT